MCGALGVIGLSGRAVLVRAGGIIGPHPSPAPGGDGNWSMLMGEVVHESELEPVEDEGIDLATSENITFENMDPGLF